MEVADQCAAHEIEPFTEPETAALVAPDCFVVPNWPNLAAAHGETVDMDSWRAWVQHCYGPGSFERHEAEKAARAHATGPAAYDPSV
jgi:hypothetical protein